jgi:hypothetical protein
MGSAEEKAKVAAARITARKKTPKMAHECNKDFADARHRGPYRRLRQLSLAALCLGAWLLGGSLISARDVQPHSWTLFNRALEITVALDSRGRLAMTHLVDRRTGYDWCRAHHPSPVLQLGFQHQEKTVALADGSSYHLPSFIALKPRRFSGRGYSAIPFSVSILAR